MRIPIEILGVFCIFLIWFGWMVWYKLSLKKLRRRYNPGDDSSKKGEESRNEPRRNRGNEGKSLSISGSNKSKGRDSVQERTTNSVKKNSRSIRKHVNPFRRRK